MLMMWQCYIVEISVSFTLILRALIYESKDFEHVMKEGNIG